MDAKISNFSELSNILSVKSSLRSNFMALFTRFGLGHLLSRLSLEKQAGIPAVQLILSLCLFRIAGESIHSIYKKSYYDLLDTGHNCYYRMMRRATMDWRKLLLGMALRFLAILRKEHAEAPSDNTSYIFDDTTLEKTGLGMEQISRVFDHVKGKCVLGYKLLVCAFFDGKSTIPIDMSLHCEKGKKKDFGLTPKQRKNRFKKKRKADNPNAIRVKESMTSKLQVAVEMLKRAWAHKSLRAKFVLCDSWFTCEYFIREVRKIGKGALHLVGLAKMGNTKYLVYGKSHNAGELVALYGGNSQFSHDCRQYKCHYIALRGKLGDQPVRIFLIKYGRNKGWNILLSTDLSMTFVKAFEVYQIRWNIEVLNKECKQYLELGKCMSRDFDAQIADCTLCFLTYITMALEKRFSEYETMGELFTGMEDDLMALTLWKRVLACIKRLLEVLSEHQGTPIDEVEKSLVDGGETISAYLLMAKALEDRKQKKKTA